MKKPYEENGCLYVFNKAKFEKIISKMAVARTQIGNRSVKTTNQQIIMNNLADAVGYSYELVRKWKSNKSNVSPIDLDVVKSIANHLEIDYLELLIPLENQEETMKHDILSQEEFLKNELNSFSEREKLRTEKMLVRSIFKRCVEIIYKRSDTTSHKMQQELDDFLEQIRKEICDIHKVIDQLSFDIDDETRMKLHVFIFEFESTFGYYIGICERWLEITDKFTVDYNFVPGYSFFNRTEAIIETSGVYLYHEIEYAERIGSTDIKMIPDEIWDKYDQTQDVSILEKYGAPYITEGISITPQMVYIDLMVNLIKEVIEIDFLSEDETID